MITRSFGRSSIFNATAAPLRFGRMVGEES
jgi:hypothetical protein